MVYALLTVRHMELLRLVASGLNREQVALKLGITAQTVTNVANSPQGKAYLEQLSSVKDTYLQNVVMYARTLLPGVVEQLGELLESPLNSPELKLKAMATIIKICAIPTEIKITSTRALDPQVLEVYNKAADVELVSDAVVLEDNSPSVNASLSPTTSAPSILECKVN